MRVLVKSLQDGTALNVMTHKRHAGRERRLAKARREGADHIVFEAISDAADPTT
jgi:hypothetical protein